MNTVKKSKMDLDYEAQKLHNEDNFRKACQIVRPDIYVLMQTLDTTGVDFTILLQTIYALERIGTGTKYGEVRLFVENGVLTFIKGEESKKINVPVIRASA